MGVCRLSIELARERPGIQLLRFDDGVLGRESGVDPGIVSPAELDGLLMSRPLLCGRPPGELGALLARSWFTASSEGGGGRLSMSRLSGIVLGSEEKTALGVETWRVGFELLWRRLSMGFSGEFKTGEDADEEWESRSLDPSENRDEIRFADLTGADNILSGSDVGRISWRKATCREG